MVGNVWEWTASDFVPFPGSRWILTRIIPSRGSIRARFCAGKLCQQRTLAWPLYRNFFTPKRNDVIAGFRSCAL
jgi:gamma-glutamyl hercynylcysteine S-oxide synthase